MNGIFNIDWRSEPYMVSYLTNSIVKLFLQHIRFHGIDQRSGKDNPVRVARDIAAIFEILAGMTEL